MPLAQGSAKPCRRVPCSALATAAGMLGALALASGAWAAEPWDRENAGVFIYQREVPTQPAQVVGEPAPPDQVILSGPDSPFDTVMRVAEPLSDFEAGSINGHVSGGMNIALPGAPPASTDPQDVVGYAAAMASSVATATQGSVVETVNQTTALLNSTTSTITNVLGKLPTSGEF